MPPRRSGTPKRVVGKPLGMRTYYQHAVTRIREQQQEALERQATFPEVKSPTNTMFPDRPRSDRATYDPATQLLNIEWARPGQLGPSTTYKNVTPQEWEQVQAEPSTGRYVNRVLNYKEYYYP